MTFDPTTNRIPFGLLTLEEQATLKAWPHGVVRWDCNDDWDLVGASPSWLSGYVYRGKPEPNVTSYWFNIYDGNRIGNMWYCQEGASYHAHTESVVMRMQICNGEVTITKET